MYLQEASCAYRPKFISALELSQKGIKIQSCVQCNAHITSAACRFVQVPNATDSTTEPGCGVTATVEGSTVAVGRLDWLQQQERIQSSSSASTSSSSSSKSSSDSSHQAGQSVVYVGLEGQGVVGSLGFSDTLRVDAQHVVQQLQSMGIQVMLISGALAYLSSKLMPCHLVHASCLCRAELNLQRLFF